ncbi:MAG: hypothetical protein PHY66_14430 [Aliarcobacter sp.]|nr:hypothetical protein [Aliarcobacter sp.]
MIVAVKRNKKRTLLKVVSLIVLAAMIGGYYYHMNKSFLEQQKKELESKQALKLEEDKKEKEKKDIENAILSEVEKAIDLVGQEHIRHVKIIEDKLIIICEPATNLDALLVRYGAMALIKKTLNEIIIAVDINFILKSRLNAK